MYFFASGGSWPEKGRTQAGFDVERETFYRLLLIQKQEDMGVHVSDEAVAKVASDRLRSMNRGNPVSPDVFIKQVLSPQGLGMLDFERFLRHELGLQQMASVLGLGGELVTPQEVRALYERENQEVQAQAAFFSATNYLASINATPEQISQFYTNQMSRYRLPERVQVNYVKFPLSNFLAEAQHELDQITNLNEVIEAKYLELGTNYFSEAKSPEEAKQKIREMALNESALMAARKKAIEFASELFNQTPVSAENLVTLAKAKGLTPLVTPPFDRDEPPAGLPVRADFIRAAFGLSEEEPFSQTLMGEDGVYLISLNKNLPSEIPALDSHSRPGDAGFPFHRSRHGGAEGGDGFCRRRHQRHQRPGLHRRLWRGQGKAARVAALRVEHPQAGRGGKPREPTPNSNKRPSAPPSAR